MHRLARDLGVAASERACQIAYSRRTLDFFEVILATWCRGKVSFPINQLESPPGAALSVWPMRILYMSAPDPVGR